MLSGEKLLSIAQQENKVRIRDLCDKLFGMVDLFTFLLIILPIYPKTVEGQVYSVNLFLYTETTRLIRTIYWTMFLGLILMGALKLLLAYLKSGNSQKTVTVCSMLLSIAAVFLLSLTRGTYAVTLLFLLLVLKGTLVFTYTKQK